MSHNGSFGPEAPLYEIKANLFKGLAHPIRIRVLEVLCGATEPIGVSELLRIIEVEPTLMSQHLAVLKRHHVVRSWRAGNAVFYEVSNEKIAQLLVIARGFLADTLRERHAQLDAMAGLPPVLTS